ncbi:cell cycle checkpoint protein RAD17 [Xylariaceae sp. FL0804]|nr:cell cycle checkpoint protein RAD17 [Xylariaceae sp. FL0804]
MASILSYIPIVNRFVSGRDGTRSIDISPVEVHHVETAPEKRPRTLKHLLRANHVNHSILYHDLDFHNHMPHILCSAYLLGANEQQLHKIYDAEAAELEPWKPSPAEITQDDWRDFLGNGDYQRAYVDFFEDSLVMRHNYDWKKVVEEYIFSGEAPLVNCLIGGLGHPLIHLGYAYEMDNREVAMEALGLTALGYNFLHKYIDDTSYTKPSTFSTTSPLELLNKMSQDDRLKGLFKQPGLDNFDPLFEKHEDIVMEYWNAWTLEDPVKQFRESQEAAVALLVATVPPGTHSYNFFTVHLLTTSHAVRILLPFIPAKFHINLVREWWLLTVAVYMIQLCPEIDPDYARPRDVDGKQWNYVEDKARTGAYATDAHYVKAIRAMREAARTWGDVHEHYLAAAYCTSAASISREPATSPSPVRKSTRLAAGQSKQPPKQPSQPSKPAVKALLSRSLNSGPKRQESKSASSSPEKAKRRPPVRSKVLSQGQGKSADLVTLFSRQAERAPAKPTTKIDDIVSDPISDDDDVGEHRAAVTSQVGQNAQRRFRDSTLPATGHPAPISSQKFLRPPRPPQGPRQDDEHRPWSERFGPVNLDELAVHKKKVADVRRWLEDVIAGRMRQRLLILKGAAGTGKTTTVKLLAKALRCELLEWRNPTGSMALAQGFLSASAQFEEFLGRGGKFSQLDIGAEDTMPGTQNRDSGDGEGRKIILIEEFPNTFTRSSTPMMSFRNAVMQYLATNTPSLAMFAHQSNSDPITPVVMVISETLLTTTSASADSFTAHRLLGPEITRHPGTCMIEFNAIAPTLLAKALELIVQKEARKSGRRRTPGPLVLKKLGEIGDVRSAVSSLEFMCLKGDNDAEWGSKITFTKPKGSSKYAISLTKGEEETLELVSQRESSLGIFHAVGKVVYNKRDELPMDIETPQGQAELLPGYLAACSRPKRSEVIVDNLIDETGTDTSTFVSALHENYALSCEARGSSAYSSLDYINGCIEYLSESDLLCPSWDIFFGGRLAGASPFGRDSASHVLRQDEMAFQVATRGLLFSLPSPVKRSTTKSKRGGSGGGGGGGGGDAFKMFYPTSIKLWREKEELESLVDHWASDLLKGGDATAAGHHNITDGASAFRRPPQAAAAAAQRDGEWLRRQTMQLTGGGGSGGGSGPRSQQKTEPEEFSPPPPLLSLGSAARREMILDRLPYMAHMARSSSRRSGSASGSVRLRELERVVSLSGIGSAADDENNLEGEDDDDDADEFLNDGAVAGTGEEGGATWATDRPTEEGEGEGASSSRRRKIKRGGGLAIRPRRKAAATAADADDDDPWAAAAATTLATAAAQAQKLVLSDDDIEDD